jgi:hypothetical protein
MLGFDDKKIINWSSIINQHRIKLGLFVCFSLFLSDCTTPLGPPPTAYTPIVKGCTQSANMTYVQLAD